jgi:hypothetical protein
MQGDGNVVLYNGNSSVEASGTNTPTLSVTRMSFTPDGAVSFYNKDNKVVAEIVPKTTGSTNYTFALSTKGELSIVDEGTKQIVWQGSVPKALVS